MDSLLNYRSALNVLLVDDGMIGARRSRIVVETHVVEKVTTVMAAHRVLFVKQRLALEPYLR